MVVILRVEGDEPAFNLEIILINYVIYLPRLLSVNIIHRRK